MVQNLNEKDQNIILISGQGLGSVESTARLGPNLPWLEIILGLVPGRGLDSTLDNFVFVCIDVELILMLDDILLCLDLILCPIFEPVFCPVFEKPNS